MHLFLKPLGPPSTISGGSTTGNRPVCNDFWGGCGGGSSSGEAATPSKAGETSTLQLTLPPWMVTALQWIGSPHFITPTLPVPPAPPAPPQSKPYDIHQPAGGCGSGLGAICPNTGANLALHFGPLSVGTPIEFNPGNVFPDGGDDSGTGGGGSGKRDDSSSGASDCGGGLSFTPDTHVATASGEQTIGTLKVGQQVWSYNPATKKMEFKPILHVWINHDNDLVDLTIAKTTKQGKEGPSKSEVIHTNKKHPFLTVEKGFLPVGQIKLGMHAVEADGGMGVVSGWKVVPGVKVMYNLEVAQDHTYTVGVGQWVVHNSSCPAGLDPSDPVVILGRNMEERVKVYAEELRNDGFDVRTYNARSKTPTLDANTSWLRYWVKKKGAQVVDIGNDPKDLSRSLSMYYEMEKYFLKQWGTKVFHHDPGY